MARSKQTRPVGRPRRIGEPSNTAAGSQPKAPRRKRRMRPGRCFQYTEFVSPVDSL